MIIDGDSNENRLAPAGSPARLSLKESHDIGYSMDLNLQRSPGVSRFAANRAAISYAYKGRCSLAVRATRNAPTPS